MHPNNPRHWNKIIWGFQQDKARLVAKGYSKKHNFDYDKIFSSVTMLKSIRIFLSIMVHLDYEIQQIDIKTLFLNNSLNESIYMMQLDGFIAKG